MHLFLLFAVPLSYAYALVLREDAGQPSSLTSISFLRGVGAYLLVLAVLLLMKRFIVRPYMGVGGYFFAVGFDFFVPVAGAFGLYHWFTPDVRGMSGDDRELALISFLAGAFSLSSLADLLIRSDYMGPYELFYLPALRVAAMLLVPSIYLLFCEETFWVRYFYLALVLLSPAAFGTVYLLHVTNIHMAAIATTIVLFAGGWLVTLVRSAQGVNVRLR
jgi:hypothetical protein